MALIQWQTNSKRHLKSLFDYYRDHASEKVALGLRDAIMGDVERLADFPTMGIRDDEFSTPDTQYYYLIIKWSKRTYRIYYLYENDICSIQAIWDCSMNPVKRGGVVRPLRRDTNSN
jgi:plasmid stabilization system protein ParE